MKRSLLIFLILLLVCGLALGTTAALTEKPAVRAQQTMIKKTLKEIYPQGDAWKTLEAPEGVRYLLVCEEKGGTPVYALFLPLEEGTFAAAIKADGTLLGEKSLTPEYASTKENEETRNKALALVERMQEVKK